MGASQMCSVCKTSKKKNEKLCTVSPTPKSGKTSDPASPRSPRAASPRRQKGDEDAREASSSPRPAKGANSGGTGDTPDKEEGPTSGTGTSGVGLASKKKKQSKEKRGKRCSSRMPAKEEEEKSAEVEMQQAATLEQRVGRTSWIDFSNPQQTIIIFDWDDTLFPTTWLQDDMNVKPGEPYPKTAKFAGPLNLCAGRASDLLRTATQLATQVSIVTLAESPWVDYTIQNFYQSIEKQLSQMNISIIYARDAAAAVNKKKKKKKGQYDKQKFQSSEEAAEYWTGIKGTAIRLECEKFYSQYAHQTWKNVISIGDSDFEKEGTIQVTQQYVLSNKHQGVYQLPRTKTVKMFDSPTAEELCNEMWILKRWLPTLVRNDEGFNLDFEDVEDRDPDDIKTMLAESRLHEAEPRSEALFDNLFWKKDKDGDPFNEAHWRPRRIWLSKSGKMWYESLKDLKAMELFYGASVGDMVISKLKDGWDVLESIEGMPVYGIMFRVADARPDYLVLAQDKDREEFLKHVESFKKGKK